MKFTPLKGSSLKILKASFFLLLFTLGILTSPGSSKVFAQAAPAPAAAAPAAAASGGGDALKGEAVFKGNCKQCHAINEVVVGPALRDAHKRWGSDTRLHGFIKYPAKTIAVDDYAKGLYEKYKPNLMPNHDALPGGDADIDAVIAYIKAESDKPVGPDPNIKTVDAKGGAAAGGSSDSGSMNFVLAGILIVLILIVAVLGMLVAVLTRMVNNKTDVTEDEKDYLFGKINWSVLFGSPIFRSVVTFIVVCFLFKVGFDQVYAIGIQQGYAPKQPIPFSHKLHAGTYEIDCNYCHTGVNKGKSATIPAANTCMNCHNAIKTESPYIKRIYAAIEKNEPIQWVRIHNLPDLAYFNHAQHVKVGGIECVTCHGPIQEMEVVQQYSTLTMGWCINCHRETVVKTGGNAYYDKLVKMHAENTHDPLKVVNIGGLECSKCHY